MDRSGAWGANPQAATLFSAISKPPIGMTMAYRCGYTGDQTVSLVKQWRRHSSDPKANMRLLLRLVSKLSGAYSGLACMYGTPPKNDGTVSNTWKQSTG